MVLVMIYAYGRVSTAEQKLDRQIEDFLSFGVEKENIYCDKKSGKDFEREVYKELLSKLRKGDLLVIKSIDRLGRNYVAIIDEWKRITRDIGADIVVLDMPLLDTRSTENNLIGKLISDIVLQILSFVAENERENIKRRQAEGIKLAKQRGKKFGRPSRPLPPKFHAVANEFYDKKITLSEALDVLDMKKTTFYRYIEEKVI